MRIAILTQPLGRNYGGMLQAFALQKILSQFGHYVITIDRQPDALGVVASLSKRLKRALKRLVKGGRNGRFAREPDETAFRHMFAFLSQHVKLSEAIFSTEGLRAHFKEKRYDAVVVGSDQTWRPKYSPNIRNYFLDFLDDSKIVRVAYASSFGVVQWEFSPKETRDCGKLAKRFDFTSVREESGIKLCRDHLGIEVVALPDPTMLLTCDDYVQLLNIEPAHVGCDFLFCYVLDGSGTAEAVVNRASEVMGLPVINAMQSASTIATVDDHMYPPVETWIRRIRDSKFVVTDSFHGCVFSILFNKPFLVLANERRGRARFESLLAGLGLANRVVSDVDAVGALLEEDVDWSAVRSLVAKQRESAFRFLTSALS